MKSVRAVRSHHVKEQDVQKLCQPTLQPSSHYMYQHFKTLKLSSQKANRYSANITVWSVSTLHLLNHQTECHFI